MTLQPPGVNDDAAVLCGCGCGRDAEPGGETAAAQLRMMRSLAERLQVMREMPGDDGERAEQMLYEYERAAMGLDIAAHNDASDVPILIGPPAAPWLHAWRREAKALIGGTQRLPRHRGKRKRRRQ